jgi:hypothetical protein
MLISGMLCSNSFSQCKALAEFLISSHDNQQVSAWVQQEKQEKQNVGENFTFQDTSPFPREEIPLKRVPCG